jgi:low affinity Fe/Cu permease
MLTEYSFSFGNFSRSVARAAGQPAAFVSALAVILIWAAAGPLFGFSDTWQLVINTGTTIVTFLMVFVIQNTQNRDGEAMQIKLDELIRSIDATQPRRSGREGFGTHTGELSEAGETGA